MQTLHKTFSNNLDQLRRSRGLSWKRMADENGISLISIYQYKQAKGLPRLDRAAALADYFSVGVDDLLGRKH